jgi:predicted dehydrogenase
MVPRRVKENLDRFRLTEGYGSMDEVCKTDLDAVVIMTQPWLHAPQAIQAMESGKHVWSAVPLISLPDGSEMLDWCGKVVETSRRTGMHYFLAETSHYYPAAMYCRRRAAEGAFGEFVYAEGRYAHDYNVPGGSNLKTVDRIRWGDQWDMSKSGMTPMHYPTHSMGGILSVVDARIEKIACLGYRHPDDEWFREDTIFKNPFSNETAFAKLSNGMSARFAECRRIAGSLYEGFEQICGTEGSFFEFGEGHGAWAPKHATELQPLTVDEMRSPLPPDVLAAFQSGAAEAGSLYGGHQGSHAYLVHEFVDAIVHDRTPAITAADAAHWLACGVAAHRSAMKDGEWMTVDF